MLNINTNLVKLFFKGWFVIKFFLTCICTCNWLEKMEGNMFIFGFVFYLYYLWHWEVYVFESHFCVLTLISGIWRSFATAKVFVGAPHFLWHGHQWKNITHVLEFHDTDIFSTLYFFCNLEACYISMEMYKYSFTVENHICICWEMAGQVSLTHHLKTQTNTDQK